MLLDVIIHSYEIHKLPLYFSKAYTVPFRKTEDAVELQQVTGYRPLTLCNMDYKVFTKIVTTRLQTVISDIVNAYQACSIQERLIQMSTHIAQSVLDCYSRDQGCVAVQQIDLEKALDHVWHDIRFCVLECVGFRNVIFQGAFGV